MNANRYAISSLIATVFVLLVTSVGTAQAELKLPAILADHMILQQGVTNAIWGTAAPGQRVSVSFADQAHSCTADATGAWAVELLPMDASSEARELTVSADTTIVITDVLVGEVWLAAGQSNMVSGIKQVPGPQRRIFVEQKANRRVRAYIGDRWYLLSEQALHTSAVGFFFALKLEQSLDLPVAYVVVAALGSKIEPFVPPAEAEAAQLGSKSSGIFKARVAPLAPYAIRGVIWYQGESNRGSTNYFECLQALHRGWARVFEMPALPFYQVQIAPYNKAETKTSLISDSVWAAQYRAAREIPGMGIIPLHDTGISVKHIHPRSKQPVGERLAALALKHQYGRDVVTSGPEFVGAIREGQTVRVSFDHIDQGLQTKDGEAPTFFEVSDDGEHFVAAQATIDGDQVRVHADTVEEPRFVRMGWFDIAIPNLQDKNGWPVYAFPRQPLE